MMLPTKFLAPSNNNLRYIAKPQRTAIEIAIERPEEHEIRFLAKANLTP
jgi:hypothetical protein